MSICRVLRLLSSEARVLQHMGGWGGAFVRWPVRPHLVSFDGHVCRIHDRTWGLDMGVSAANIAIHTTLYMLRMYIYYYTWVEDDGHWPTRLPPAAINLVCLQLFHPCLCTWHRACGQIDVATFYSQEQEALDRIQELLPACRVRPSLLQVGCTPRDQKETVRLVCHAPCNAKIASLVDGFFCVGCLLQIAPLVDGFLSVGCLMLIVTHTDDIFCFKCPSVIASLMGGFFIGCHAHCFSWEWLVCVGCLLPTPMPRCSLCSWDECTCTASLGGNENLSRMAVSDCREYSRWQVSALGPLLGWPQGALIWLSWVRSCQSDAGAPLQSHDFWNFILLSYWFARSWGRDHCCMACAVQKAPSIFIAQHAPLPLSCAHACHRKQWNSDSALPSTFVKS